MRRILSFLLLLVFALPLVAPALGQTVSQTVSQTAPKKLLCCLKGGAHHCSEAAATQGGLSGHAFRAHCPAWTNPAVAGYAANWMHVGASSSHASLAVAALGMRQIAAGYQRSPDLARQQRGPPATNLL